MSEIDMYKNIGQQMISDREKIKELEERINKAIEYIKINCITSDEWKDLGFCNFVATGKITYKQLSKNKINKLLIILRGDKE